MKHDRGHAESVSVQAMPDADNLDPAKPQPELDLGIPQTLRTEFNFLKYPFFDIGGDSKRTKIEINESVITDEGAFHILWRVTRNSESRFPGDFEKRVHRAVEQIVNATPKPIQNPLRIGSVHSIAKLMGIAADSGKNYQDIQRALKNIVKTSVEAEGTFQLKDSKSKRFINDTFHLYDRVIFKGEVLPGGETADAIFLMLGSWYLQNINANYVVPLDWRFYTQLQGSITTRMYEYLSIQFFVALEQKREFVEIRYKQVCEYFPLVRQYPGWKARKQLKQAHELLARAGYFLKVEWCDTSESDDWILRYWIGSRARSEYERNKAEVRQIGGNAKPIPFPERRRRKQLGTGKGTTSPPEAQKQPLERDLVETWGMTADVAKSLLKTHSEARIREVLDWAGFVKAKKPALIAKNPAGWIRKALNEHWGKPAGYESEEERAAKLVAQEERTVRQKAYLELQAQEDEWRTWFESTPKQRVKGEMFAWSARYKRERGKEPSREEWQQKEAELIAALPSNEQRQREIFGTIKYSNQA